MSCKISFTSETEVVAPWKSSSDRPSSTDVDEGIPTRTVPPPWVWLDEWYSRYSRCCWELCDRTLLMLPPLDKALPNSPSYISSQSINFDSVFNLVLDRLTLYDPVWGMCCSWRLWWKQDWHLDRGDDWTQWMKCRTLDGHWMVSSDDVLDVDWCCWSSQFASTIGDETRKYRNKKMTCLWVPHFHFPRSCSQKSQLSSAATYSAGAHPASSDLHDKRLNIQWAPKVSGHPREPYGKPLFPQGEKVVKFSFDLNENFFLGFLKCQEQPKFFFEF
jgi:hypothetical protein